MILRIRNTLLSTILLYDVVLASQGIEALNWIDRMDSDPDYAGRFRNLYNTMSGVTVEVFNEDGTVGSHHVKDAGPLSWKSTALELPVPASGTLRTRLRFVADNVMIDRVGFWEGISQPGDVMTEALVPVEVRDHTSRNRRDVASALQASDESYLVSQPGDWYEFEYAVPAKQDLRVSLLLESKGYYHEWVRGSWVRERGPNPHFELSDVKSTLRSLARSWLQDREDIENRFFETRIPLRRSQ